MVAPAAGAACVVHIWDLFSLLDADEGLRRAQVAFPGVPETTFATDPRYATEVAIRSPARPAAVAALTSLVGECVVVSMWPIAATLAWISRQPRATATAIDGVESFAPLPDAHTWPADFAAAMRLYAQLRRTTAQGTQPAATAVHVYSDDTWVHDVLARCVAAQIYVHRVAWEVDDAEG